MIPTRASSPVHIGTRHSTGAVVTVTVPVPTVVLDAESTAAVKIVHSSIQPEPAGLDEPWSAALWFELRLVGLPGLTVNFILAVLRCCIAHCRRSE